MSKTNMPTRKARYNWLISRSSLLVMDGNINNSTKQKEGAVDVVNIDFYALPFSLLLTFHILSINPLLDKSSLYFI